MLQELQLAAWTISTEGVPRLMGPWLPLDLSFVWSSALYMSVRDARLALSVCARMTLVISTRSLLYGIALLSVRAPHRTCARRHMATFPTLPDRS